MSSLKSLARSSVKSLNRRLTKIGTVSTSVEALADLGNEVWKEILAMNPEMATAMGFNEYDDEVSDMSVESFEKNKELLQAFLNKLNTLFPDSQRAERTKKWTLDQRVTLGVLKNKLEDMIEGIELKTYFLCVHTMESPLLNWPQVISKMKFNSVGDLIRYKNRLAKIPAQLDQYCVLLSRGLDEGVTSPKVCVESVPAAIRAMVDGKPNFYQKMADDAFEKIADVPDSLKGEITQVIDELLASFLRFAEYLETEHVPNLSECLCIAERCANGEAIYNYFVKNQTTTELSAAEIHQIGLDEVSRIMSTMKQIAKDEGFETVEAYQDHLDATFFYKTEEELLNYYKGVAMNIAPKLPSIIGKLPRTPFGVKAIPSYAAPTAPPAYYEPPPQDLSQAGFFSLNCYKPETRKTYISHALVAHEGCPGHHLQLALATENQNLPSIRKYTWHTAYVEGWGLYCEYLGHELGLYKKPEQHYGRLVIEMMRACRLVVDTGMNGEFKWTKAKSLQYMLDNKAGTPGDLDSETTRYCAIPGQALSYKIGEIKIRELRTMAEAKLGDKFSVRDFHDLILEVGSVPLSTLEEIVEDFIVEKQR